MLAGGVACFIVAALVVLIQRAGNRRSEMSSIARVGINFLQMVRLSWCRDAALLLRPGSPTPIRHQQNAALGAISVPMPAGIAAALSMSSVGDGFSVNLAPFQCITKVCGSAASLPSAPCVRVTCGRACFLNAR